MQVDRYVMHQLFELEQTALSSYAQFNFPKGSPILFQARDRPKTFSSYFYPGQLYKHHALIPVLRHHKG